MNDDAFMRMADGETSLIYGQKKYAKAQIAKVLALQKLSLEGLREEITNILSNNIYMDEEEGLSGIGVSTEYILLKVQQALLLGGRRSEQRKP